MHQHVSSQSSLLVLFLLWSVKKTTRDSLVEKGNNTQPGSVSRDASENTTLSPVFSLQSWQAVPAQKFWRNYLFCLFVEFTSLRFAFGLKLLLVHKSQMRKHEISGTFWTSLIVIYTWAILKFWHGKGLFSRTVITYQSCNMSIGTSICHNQKRSNMVDHILHQWFHGKMYEHQSMAQSRKDHPMTLSPHAIAHGSTLHKKHCYMKPFTQSDRHLDPPCATYPGPSVGLSQLVVLCT